MEIQVDKRVNRIILHCTGRLDAASAPDFEKKIMTIIKDQQVTTFLNFSGVDYISSAGVRSLIFLFKEAKGIKKNDDTKIVPMIRLINPSPAVQNILDMIGLKESLLLGDIGTVKSAPIMTKGVSYEDLLKKVRIFFPAPISDPVHDAYFVQSVAKGLNAIDNLKGRQPFLGTRTKLEYDSVRSRKLSEKMSSLEETITDIADYMQGNFIWGHPHTQENVIPPPTIASVIGQLFCSIYNPNVIWDEYSYKLSQAEVEVASICEDLVGYDQKTSVGVFTFGGTGTTLYGVKLGIEKASPGVFRIGMHEKLHIVASEAAHYAKLSVLGWLGLGLENLVTVPTDSDNSMDLVPLEMTLRKMLEKGEKIACIIATMGTTDAFGIDNLEYVVHLRDKLVDEYKLPYRPHVHADAVIGWAWAVFNDYDFEHNPMGFPMRTLRSLWDTHINLRALHLADSIGLDFHKSGYGPYVSSMFMCKDRKDLDLITRDNSIMPYMFQFGNYHPGVFTLEASRSGGSVLSALANLKLLGKEGYRTIIGHIVTMAETLRASIEKTSYACLVNNYNYGPVTLFRLYPDGVDAVTAFLEETTDPSKVEQLKKNDDYNRRIFKVLYRQMEEGNGIALSYTDRARLTSYGEPVLALKSFVMSPFIDESAMDFLMTCLENARKECKF
jgi:anti-anti-sigma factor